MPDLLPQPPATPRTKRGFFTSENAAMYARKSHALDSARNQKPVADPSQALAVQSVEPAQVFVEKRLTRVREQLERLDDLVKTEKDAKMLKALADATTRLSEQERILAGRPLPGSRRPREDRGRVSAGWIELQPALPSAPAAQVAAAPTTPEVACLDCLVTAPVKPLGWEYDDPTPAVLESESVATVLHDTVQQHISPTTTVT